MIEDLRLISRANNQVSYPNHNWERLDKIYVTGLLNLGLSDRVHFTQHNCPTLLDIIKLIQNIRYGSKSEIELLCQEGRIKIETDGKSTFRIYKYKLNGTIQLVTEKEHYDSPGRNYMLESIWKQIEPLNRKLRNKIAHILQKIDGIRENENGLRIGDKVKTSEQAKNKREGIISWIEHHNKDNKTYTKIIIDGIQHKRRYEINELELNENDR